MAESYIDDEGGKKGKCLIVLGGIHPVSDNMIHSWCHLVTVERYFLTLTDVCWFPQLVFLHNRKLVFNPLCEFQHVV